MMIRTARPRAGKRHVFVVAIAGLSLLAGTAPAKTPQDDMTLVPLRSTDPSRALSQNSRNNTPSNRSGSNSPVRGSSFSDPAPRRNTQPNAATGSSFSEPSRRTSTTRADSDSARSSAAAAAVAASVQAARAAGATPIGTPVPLAPAPAGGEGFTGLGWDTLAGYKYREPIPTEGSKPQDNAARRPKNQIPQHVLAWDKQKVEVEGWMVPMEVDDNGMIKSFVLVRVQPECCFGDTQAMNEWIEVKMASRKRAEFVVDRPIRVRGQIEVGELIEDGFVLSLYRMTAEDVQS